MDARPLTVYRQLLRAFPAEFRARFGDDMTDVFADRLRDAQRDGRAAVAALWWRTAIDLAAHSAAERRAERRRNTLRRSLMRRLFDDLIAAVRTSARQPAFGLAAAAAGTEIPFVTFCRDEVVGSTRFLALRPEHRSVEIGWTWLHASAWGTGANVAAKLLQLQHAFDEWKCRRVEFKTDASNERSCGALAALGATFEGVHRKHMLVRDGENRDSAWFSVTDDDWPGVRARLEARLAER